MNDVNEYKISPSDLTIGDEIGGGGFGTCYLSKWEGEEGGGVDVVVKIIKLIKNITSKQVFKEILLQLNLNSPAICRVFGFSILEANKICIVMEKMDSDLNSYVAKTKPNLKEKFKLLLKMSQCVKILHNKNIIHRDIKCANFLINASKNVKITDFGHSTVMDLSKSYIQSGKQGTIAWSAPECLTNVATYSIESDIYSLGCAFYEVICEENPLPVMVSVLQKQLPPKIKNGNYPKEFINLMKKCLSNNRKKRPEAFEIIRVLQKLI